jgi:hypothetical protein
MTFYASYRTKPLQHGDLIAVEGSHRYWVVLNISKKDLQNGINAPSPGLYGFGGMWYGRKVFHYKSYGKIQSLDDVKITWLGRARSFSIKDIKEFTN